MNKLKSYEKILQESFVTLQYARDKNNKALQQSKILKDLPKSNTPEWKNFIQAGQSYSLKLEEEDKKRCPYCHQELKTNEAIKIIQAYTDFLNDTSEAELSKAKKDVDDIKKDIEKLDTTIPLMEEISDIVNNYEQFKEKYTQLHLYKKSLLNAIKKDDINDFKFNFGEEIILIDIEIKKNDKQIKELSSSQEDKDKEITKLQKKIAELKEKVSIAEQKDDIKEYFSVYDTLKKYEIKKKDLTTRSLTRIANEAHANLLTESLRSRFQTELQCLWRNDLKVQLIVVNGNKGNCITQLQLCGKFKLANILSEGEQKAVGLAMFFAEIQSGNNPIILDDPTTSLDHKIAKKLAVRLISFTNQVIIFTHHQLFLNFLNSDKYKGHFCGKYGEKTCNKSGKHIFVYYVDESIYEKGVINQYDGQNAETYIEKIEQEIISITTSNLKDVPTNMRKCIDYIIDEKILKEQLLRKYSAGDQIRWDILKQLNPSLSQSIDKLHKIYGRVSGGTMHVGLESEENPLTPEELFEYLQDLKSIYSEGKEK